MVNLVPLTFLSLFAYGFLRIVVGMIWIHLARVHYKNWDGIMQTLHTPLWPWPRIALFLIIGTELVVGVLFVLGLFTQVAAALGTLWCIKLILLRPYFSHHSFPNQMTLVLLGAIGITLFITGAGVPAFDLPI